MKILKVEFSTGTYNKKCDIFHEKTIGSVSCVGHTHLNIPKCEFCKGFTENNSYYLPILNETTKIVDTVLCDYPRNQLKLF
jgi:hypothetical protein